MMEETSIKEFIQRVETGYKDEIEAYVRKQRDAHNKKQKTYFATPEGKEMCRRGDALRKERMRKAREGLTQEEDKKITEFYKNRPKGHHVDHIIPICKGGLHRLNNLQYLPAEKHREKFTKIDLEKE